MSLSCFGSVSPSLRSPPRSPSATKTVPHDDHTPVDYSPMYKLQENNVRFQKGERAMIKGVVKIMSKFSREMKEWQAKWHQFHEVNQIHLTSAENIWHLFATSITAVDLFVDQLDDSIEKLNSARELIPKPENTQLLQYKIDQARADVDKLSKEIDELNEKENHFQCKIVRLESTTSNHSSSKITQSQQQSHAIRAAIHKKEILLAKKRKVFHRKEVELFEESEEQEVHRCDLLKRQLNVLVQSFNIDSEEFKDALSKYNSKADLVKWKKEFFHK